MKTINPILKHLALVVTIFLAVMAPLAALAQGCGELKWLRVGELRGYISEQGRENHACASTDKTLCVHGFAWPSSYGQMTQSTTAHRVFFLGCKDFYDPIMEREYSYKINSRSGDDAGWEFEVFPAGINMTGKNDPVRPDVRVNGEAATDNTLYDEVDAIDPGQKPDRVIVSRFHTAMGVTVTKKVYAFSQQNHDNYFIYDFVLKNTGIIDGDGTEYKQTIKDLVVTWFYRWALSGESVPAHSQGWGEWNSTWGRNVVGHVIGTDPDAAGFEMRAMYGWYSPHSAKSFDDWGAPNPEADLSDDIPDEVLAAAKYVGVVTLHADTSPQDPADDPSQPRSTWYVAGDTGVFGDHDQYDEVQMQQEYEFMTSGHPAKTHAEEVGDGNGDKWGDDPGGYPATHSYGPYTLQVGDSVRIVLAECVAGLSREKNREVAKNWLTWYKKAGTPTLVMPNGAQTTDYDAYKEAWVKTCEDSILQTFRRAIYNYENDYNIPQPPDAPAMFEVKPGGDKITLTWADNATSHPHFDGYQIYRSRGSVQDELTVYEKIFECDAANVVHQYEDRTAQRGMDYYYYIVSKDDGSQNIEHPGVPLVSSKFYTITNKPANLLRVAGTALDQIRVAPNPYVISKRALQFGDTDSRSYDRIAFFDIPGQCKIKVFTERGDLIWEADHTNGSGDHYWESVTSSGQVVVSGIYIAYFEVTEDIVDNETGELLFAEGDHAYRKFIIIR